MLIRLTPLTKTVLIVLWILTGGIAGTYIIGNFVPTFASTCALAIVLLASIGLPVALTWRKLR
jgi:hypothetical protein